MSAGHAPTSLFSKYFGEREGQRRSPAATRATRGAKDSDPPDAA